MIFLKAHLVVVAATCIVAPSLSAQTTMTTDPVGFTTTSLLGNSDTYVGVPFTRPPEFTGMVQSADENTLTINGTPGWTNNQFVYSAGIQPKHYYVLIGNGGAVNPNEGHIYHITGNGSNTLSVDTTFESLRGIVANTEVTVIPYWTPATIFPATDAGVSFTATTSSASYQTQLRVPNASTAGINLPYSAIYFFSNNVNGTSNNIGWRVVGDNTTAHDDDPLLPDSYFVIRNQNGAPTLPLTAFGSVLMKKFAVPLLTSRTQQQDNAIALIRPVDVPLVSTGLAPIDESFTEYDQLMIFDNTQPSFDKAPSAIFVFRDGWKSSTDLGTDRGNYLIHAGSALLVRKAPTTDGTVFSHNSPTYPEPVPIMALQVASRKQHGNGHFNVNLPTVLDPGIECRVPGANNSYSLIYTFNRPVSSADGARLTQGSGNQPTVTVGPNANQLTVSLSGLATTPQHLVVALNGIHDTQGNTLTGMSSRLDVLIGDSTGNGAVNASDISQTQAQSGKPVTLSNFRNDMNANGSINSSDISLVQSKSGTRLPAN
jgi:uncharacterized protein (TIGR02597 family)